MPDSRWENLKEIFHAAVALAPNERAVYLERSCSGNDSLRRAVESLIKSHEEMGNFVDTPAYQAAAEMLVDGVDLKAGKNIAHYRIVRLLGEGGMGTVYLAEDTKLHHSVAWGSTNKNPTLAFIRVSECRTRMDTGLQHAGLHAEAQRRLQHLEPTHQRRPAQTVNQLQI